MRMPFIFMLFFEEFWFLEASPHIGRKPKHLWRGSHGEEPMFTDPQPWLRSQPTVIINLPPLEWDILKVDLSVPRQAASLCHQGPPCSYHLPSETGLKLVWKLCFAGPEDSVEGSMVQVLDDEAVQVLSCPAFPLRNPYLFTQVLHELSYLSILKILIVSLLTVFQLPQSFVSCFQVMFSCFPANIPSKVQVRYHCVQ